MQRASNIFQICKNYRCIDFSSFRRIEIKDPLGLLYVAIINKSPVTFSERRSNQKRVSLLVGRLEVV